MTDVNAGWPSIADLPVIGYGRLMLERLHLKISGRVQGVFFRAKTQATATQLGVTGWVRNCADGGVEVVAEGPRTQLKTLLQWCHHGPPAARVEHIEVAWQVASGEFSSFQITA